MTEQERKELTENALETLAALVELTTEFPRKLSSPTIMFHANYMIEHMKIEGYKPMKEHELSRAFHDLSERGYVVIRDGRLPGSGIKGNQMVFYELNKDKIDEARERVKGRRK